MIGRVGEREGDGDVASARERKRGKGAAEIFPDGQHDGHRKRLISAAVITAPVLKARYIGTPKIGMLGKGFAPVHADC